MLRFEHWPSNITQLEDFHDSKKRKHNRILVTIDNKFILERFSKFSVLIRVDAYIYSFFLMLAKRIKIIVLRADF